MMRSNNDPRRLYRRTGSLVLCFDGAHFGPKSNAESKFDHEAEVVVEEAKPAGGKRRLNVTQEVGGKEVTEVWIQKELKSTRDSGRGRGRGRRSEAAAA